MTTLFSKGKSLTTQGHFDLCHSIDDRGRVSIADRGHGLWNEHSYPIEQAHNISPNCNGVIDIYFSQQAFRGWRRIANLWQLKSCYVDVDYHKTERWHDKSPEVVAEQIRMRLEDSGLPAPRIIFATGRGLLVCWMFDAVPRQALPRWNAIQRVLCHALTGFGVDSTALDCTRVFRFLGSINSKSGSTVYAVWQNLYDELWDFEDFACEVLPVDRQKLVSLQVEKAKRLKKRKPKLISPPAHQLNAATLWATVLSDLQKLREVRWWGELPPGHRDIWMFYACNAMSWLCRPVVLPREVIALGRIIGWPDRETRSNMGTIIRNNQAAYNGYKKIWKDEEVDPRYRVKANTIIEALEITPAEMREANLRVLVDDILRRENKTTNERQRRQRLGAKDRKQNAQERLELGREALRSQQLEGLSQRQLAQKFGVAKATIAKAISEVENLNEKANEINVVAFRVRV